MKRPPTPVGVARGLGDTGAHSEALQIKRTDRRESCLPFPSSACSVPRSRTPFLSLLRVLGVFLEAHTPQCCSVFSLCLRPHITGNYSLDS